MATFQPRGGKWRAIVRRKSFPSQTRTFPTKTAAKTAAKTWADRIERELAEREASGTTAQDDATIGDQIDWRTRELGSAKAISKTQAGNMTRLREGLGSIVARRLTANDVIGSYPVSTDGLTTSENC